MDHEELIRRFHIDPETLSPEVRAIVDAANAHTQALEERGQHSTRRPGDNFAIGLDDNYNPFPVTNPVPKQDESDET